MLDQIVKMFPLLGLLLALLCGGCSHVTSGLCWVDRQIPACEWAGEDETPAPKPVDPLPGSGK